MEAATIHRENHDPKTVQVSYLCCPFLKKQAWLPWRIVAYCPQAAPATTPNLEGNDLMSVFPRLRAQPCVLKRQGALAGCVWDCMEKECKDGPEFDQVLGNGTYQLTKLDMRKFMLHPGNDYRKSGASFLSAPDFMLTTI